ncbi:MAG: flagellar basal body P-ring formation chaperone FlgA [Pseudomonadota bacterium]
MSNDPLTPRRTPSAAFFIVATLGVFALFPRIGNAVAYESVESIRALVKQYVEGYDFGSDYPVSVVVGKLDSRLRLQKCATPIDVAFAANPANSGRTFLSVSCTTGKVWTVYVGATVDAHADVWVANHALTRGHIVSEHDIIRATRKLSNLRGGYYADKQQLLGLQLKRSVNAGDALSPLYLVKRSLIKRGQVVTIVASVGGIDVQMKGTALTDATRNSLVKVKNSSSGRVVQGRVIDVGKVKISM